MKNIYLLADECIADLIRAGIPIHPVRNWLVGTRGKNMWGQCKAVENGMFDIKEVSSVEATGANAWAWGLTAFSAVGSYWLVASIPAILAC